MAATVADYLDMLEVEQRGQRINKAQHRRRLMGMLRGRTSSAVEMKHQNISAVLRDSGHPFIEGYKPLGNYQGALIDEVRGQLEARPVLKSLIERNAESLPIHPFEGWGDPDRLLVEPPGSLARERARPSPLAARSGQFVDYVQKDAENRRLGELGERFVVDLERARLRKQGSRKLAERVTWASRDKGDGLGYDIESFLATGQPIMIEVKTTNHHQRFPFMISRNEVAASERFDEQYRLYRVFRFSIEPRIYVLKGPVTRACRLEPHVFRGYPS